MAETEVSIEPERCKPETSSRPVPTSFLLPNATEQVDPVSQATSTILVVTSSVLLTAFLLMLVLVLVVKRAEFLSVFKFLRREIRDSAPKDLKNIEVIDQNNRLAYYINNIDEDSNNADSLKNNLNDTQTFYV